MFSGAGRAKTLKANLLAADYETFVGALYHRQRHSHQAVCTAAACTGKMRMALALGAVMGQFVMSRSFGDESFMNQPDFQ
jgi:hypothetical protein